MTPLALIIPKGWAIAVWASGGAVIAANFSFSDTVTIGSIILASLVVVLGGLFTLRNNVHSFWRGLAEERAEQITLLNTQLTERDQRVHEMQDQAAAERAKLVEEQGALRHELKNQLAAATGLLAVEKQKTDLTSLLELLARQHDEAMGKLVEGLSKQDDILHALTEPQGGHE